MLWIKAFHIIAVVCWFAGLFYLPRLFVYHSESQDEISHDRFVIMARRLYNGIMMPSMIAGVVLGLWLLVLVWPAYGHQAWLHAKLALVLLLLAYHLYCNRLRIALAERRSQHSSRYFRIFNELPVLALVVIVILVVVKPI